MTRRHHPAPIVFFSCVSCHWACLLSLGGFFSFVLSLSSSSHCVCGCPCPSLQRPTVWPISAACWFRAASCLCPHMRCTFYFFFFLPVRTFCFHPPPHLSLLAGPFRAAAWAWVAVCVRARVCVCLMSGGDGPVGVTISCTVIFFFFSFTNPSKEEDNVGMCHRQARAHCVVLCGKETVATRRAPGDGSADGERGGEDRQGRGVQ